MVDSDAWPRSSPASGAVSAWRGSPSSWSTARAVAWHGGDDALIQQALCENLRLGHEIVLVAESTAIDASIVNRNIGPALSTQEVVDGLSSQLALQIPQRNIQRRKRPHFRTGEAVEIGPTENRVPYVFGIEDRLIQREVGDHVEAAHKRLALASITFQEGHHAQAIDEAFDAMEELQEHGNVSLTVMALEWIAALGAERAPERCTRLAAAASECRAISRSAEARLAGLRIRSRRI